MSRTLTSALNSALQADTVQPILLVKIGSASGDVRVWSGYGELTFNGEVYLGAGELGGVSPITESTDLVATGAKFSLDGMDSALLSAALGDMQQGRTATMWLGALDMTTGALIADPVEMFSGLTDVPEINESGETATISISAESRLIELEKAPNRRYTSEDQKIDDPTDLGFEFVPTLQDADVRFGGG